VNKWDDQGSNPDPLHNNAKLYLNLKKMKYCFGKTFATNIISLLKK
jgi:hypothetical protein